jgi:diguanylate cyclase
MRYDHDIKDSETYALASFQEMKKNAVPYNPVNFSVWYNFHSRINVELVRRMENMIEAAGHIDDEQSSALFDEFVSGEILDKSRKISEKLEFIAREITDNLEKTDKSSGDYVGQMETLQSDLSSAPTIGDADNVINMILSASQKVTSEIKALRENASRHQEEMEALRKELVSTKDESRTDQLTGIANRRQFNERLRQLWDISSKNSEPFSLVMGDIDHFKSFNDQFGHQVGDHVLSVIGEQLRQNVKGKDMAARYGGEEFALLLPNTSLTDAISFANSLREIICANPIKLGDSKKTITMSFGVAQLDLHETSNSLIERADKNLYLAKEAGRNTVSPPLDNTKDHEFEIIEIKKMR